MSATIDKTATTDTEKVYFATPDGTRLDIISIPKTLREAEDNREKFVELLKSESMQARQVKGPLFGLRDEPKPENVTFCTSGLFLAATNGYKFDNSCIEEIRILDSPDRTVGNGQMFGAMAVAFALDPACARTLVDLNDSTNLTYSQIADVLWHLPYSLTPTTAHSYEKNMLSAWTEINYEGRAKSDIVLTANLAAQGFPATPRN